MRASWGFLGGSATGAIAPGGSTCQACSTWPTAQLERAGREPGLRSPAPGPVLKTEKDFVKDSAPARRDSADSCAVLDPAHRGRGARFASKEGLSTFKSSRTTDSRSALDST